MTVYPRSKCLISHNEKVEDYKMFNNEKNIGKKCVLCQISWMYLPCVGHSPNLGQPFSSFSLVPFVVLWVALVFCLRVKFHLSIIIKKWKLQVQTYFLSKRFEGTESSLQKHRRLIIKLHKLLFVAYPMPAKSSL